MADAIRVLYVDDEPDLLEIGKLFLLESGDFLVTTIDSAPAALELLKKEQFDAIISDYQMQGMDGIEFLIEVRKTIGKIPFIMFTGKGREEVVIQAINSGADFYLQKGGEPNAQFVELEHKIKNAVESRRAWEEIWLSHYRLTNYENEEKYRKLIETTDTGFVIIDEKGRVKDANLEYVRLTGHTSIEEIIGRSVVEWTAPQEKDKNVESINECMRTGYIRNHEIDYVNKYGTIISIEINATVLRSGNLIQIFTLCRDITERKRMAEALKYERDQVQRYLNLANVMLVALDREGKVTLINRKGCEILGYSKEEILGRNWFETFLPKESNRELKDVFDQIIAGDPADLKYYENPVITKTNEKRIIAFHNTFMSSSSGITGVLFSGQDITDQKQMENALQDKVKRLNMALGVAKAGIWEWNLETDEVLFDNRFHELLGYKPGELPNKAEEWQKYHHPDDLLEMLSRARAYLFGETLIFESEHRIRTKAGNWNWVFTRGEIVNPAPTGSKKQFIGIATNITERKQAEEALKKNTEALIAANEELVATEEELRANYDELTQKEEALQESRQELADIIEFLPDATFVIDRKGIVITWNRAMQEMTGIGKEEMIGQGEHAYTVPFYGERRKQLLDLIDMEDEELKKKYQYVTRKGNTLYTEVFTPALYGGKGAYVWATGSPLFDINGNRIGAIESIRDITEHKQVIKEREVLLSEVHHRVKNNFAGIIGLIDLYISKLTDPVIISQFRELATRIRSMAIIHEQLYNSKDLTRINPATYTETLALYLFQMYETTTKVNCVIDMEDLMLSFETIIPLGLVISEIITNSLKYAFPDTFSCKDKRGEPCTITISLKGEGNDYLLTIADNGTGIPEPIDVTSSNSLGQFLVRFIVEHQLRGSIEINTTKGTAYTIRFPKQTVKIRHFEQSV